MDARIQQMVEAKLGLGQALFTRTFVKFPYDNPCRLKTGTKMLTICGDAVAGDSFFTQRSGKNRETKH